jgi:hypothetical protein
MDSLFFPNPLDTDCSGGIPDEEFVPDYRARLTPSEVVQSKLLSLMPDMPVPVSSMHAFRDTRRTLSVSI